MTYTVFFIPCFKLFFYFYFIWILLVFSLTSQLTTVKKRKKKFSKQLLHKLQLTLMSPTPTETYSEPCQEPKMEFFLKIDNGFQALDLFCKKPRLRCLTKLSIHLCSQAANNHWMCFRCIYQRNESRLYLHSWNLSILT